MKCDPLCHFVNKKRGLKLRRQGVEEPAVFASRDELAQIAVVLRDHASRRVIRTTAARRTPKASRPVLIWPNAMLNKVAATVADPISSGMAQSPVFDLRLEHAV